MELQEILENLNKDKLKQWLTTAGLPFLREPAFFEEMGFPSWFVRQFYRKHKCVLLSSGTIQRKVRGVNDIDFIYGLAEIMGIDVSAVNGNKNKHASIIAHQCLQMLDVLNDDVNSKEIQYATVSKKGMI